VRGMNDVNFQIRLRTSLGSRGKTWKVGGEVIGIAFISVLDAM
jgi:hypothetical protein